MVKSFANAFRGIWDCINSERHMRVHLAACCYVLFFAFRLGLSRVEIAVLCLTVGLVTAMEAINTAVEKLCDFAEPRRTPRIRLVKDMAAAAVLLSALGAVGVGLALFLRPELWALLVNIATTPSRLLLLLASLALAVWFVFGWRKR